MSNAAPSYAEVAAAPPVPADTPTSSAEHAGEAIHRPQSSSSESAHSTSSNEVVVVAAENDGHDDESDEDENEKEDPETEATTTKNVVGHLEKKAQYAAATVTTAASSASAKLPVSASDVSAVAQRAVESVKEGAEMVKEEASKIPGAVSKGVDEIKDGVKKAELKLPGFLEKTDEIVNRLSKLMSNSTGQDRALMTISYGLTALTSHMDYLSHYRALAHARDAQKVVAVPVGLSSYLVFARPPGRSRLVGLSARLKALVALIGDYRIFVRLWGMLGMWQWLRATLKAPPSDATVRKITYAQVAVNVIYQILENVAYLGGKKVLPVSSDRQNKYWLWSSRCWMAHVILEFWRLKRVRDLAVQQQSESADTGVTSKWFDIAGIVKGQDAQSAWLRSLWVNAAYAPLTVHWSLEGGALSQLSVGTLGVIAGAIGLSQQWRNTA